MELYEITMDDKKIYYVGGPTIELAIQKLRQQIVNDNNFNSSPMVRVPEIVMIKKLDNYII
jgi:hypothetical protein